MKFTAYDLSGDVSINYVDGEIHIAAKDVNKAEASCLVRVIQKSKLKVYRKTVEGSHDILLTGKGVKKAMELFFKEQIKQLKRNEFFLMTTKDDHSKLVSFAFKLPWLDDIDKLKEALKIPTVRRGCGEDPEKIKGFLSTMKEFEYVS